MALRTSTQRRTLRGLGNGVLLVMFLWTAIPFYWMVATSLKHDPEIYGYEATLIPERPTLDNYATVFRETPYLLYLRNSVAVAVGSTVLSMVIAVLGAYAIARLDFPDDFGIEQIECTGLRRHQIGVPQPSEREGSKPVRIARCNNAVVRE